MSVAACQAMVAGRLCLFTVPWLASQILSMARCATGTATEIRPLTEFKPSSNQPLSAGTIHAFY